MIEIDLSAPEGNAFELIGFARRLGKRMGMSRAEIEKITAQMMGGDYDNLIEVFDDHFGDHVILYKP